MLCLKCLGEVRPVTNPTEKGAVARRNTVRKYHNSKYLVGCASSVYMPIRRF